MVRAPDLKSGDPEFGHPEFKSRSDHLLELLQVVPRSTPLMLLFFIYLSFFCRFIYVFHLNMIEFFLCLFAKTMLMRMVLSLTTNL